MALDADNVEGPLWHGWCEKEASNLPVTEDAYRHLIAVESPLLKPANKSEKVVVHAVSEGPVVSADVSKLALNDGTPSSLIPLTVWLRPWVYERLAEGAKEYGALLKVFVAMHLEEACALTDSRKMKRGPAPSQGVIFIILVRSQLANSSSVTASSASWSHIVVCSSSRTCNS